MSEREELTTIQKINEGMRESLAKNTNALVTIY